MIVMKFGGTSVGSGERLSHVAALVAAQPGPVAVVVSAMGGATDGLLAMGRRAEGGDLDGAWAELDALRERHRAACPSPEVFSLLEPMFEDLSDLLHGVSLLREQTPRSRALLASFGERLCAPMAAGWLRLRGCRAAAVDARELVVTDAQHEAATVDMAASRQRARERLLPLLQDGVVPVITGFVGADPRGVTTLLGRGGSDYSGALFGAFLDADAIWIWTDVDGILSADPRVVRDARTLAAVSYREAAEMSYFGAKVVHPKTMLPAREQGIPIVIRSTFEPERAGTRIAEGTVATPFGVKTVTAMRRQALVTVEGPGLAGIPGVARRIFASSEASGANVVMISQASSEQTVSMVVAAADTEALVGALDRELALERAAGLISAVAVLPDVAVVSVIGAGMAGRPGTSARLFDALGRTGVNVLAIAQGASELSISVAVGDREADRAVRAVHAAFGLRRTLDVVMIGAGRVGASFAAMVASTRDELARTRSLSLRLLGVVTRSGAVLDPGGIEPSALRARLATEAVALDDAALLDAIDRARSADVVLVDLTAAETAPLHLAALERGFHVVTANKKPLAGPFGVWRKLLDAVRRTGATYGYETTFGAGLPVLHTLQEMVHTGDALMSVSGCFSGTLGFLCTRLQDGAGLAEAVQEAAELGYTEPDPRDDLSGLDVGRKALIVARAMGIILEPADLVLEPFVPDLEGGLEAALALHGPAMSERIRAAAEQGRVLRYVAEITPERVEVGLREVSATSPIGSLRGPDNILVFRTARYRDYPLVIRGPGAGAEVTAAGVLGDVLRVAAGG